MNLLRHILSHLLLITFLVAIVLAYYFRPVVFPDTVNSKINGWVESVYPPAVRLVYHQPQQQEQANKTVMQPAVPVDITPTVKTETATINNEEASTPIEIKEKEVEAVVAAVVEKMKDYVQEAEEMPTAETSIQEQPETLAVTPIKQEQPETLAVVPTKEEQPEALTQTNAQPALVEAEKSSAAVPELVQEERSVVASDQDVVTEQGLLAAARQAYQQQDIDGAIKKYSQLTELDEHSPNAFGEMGNIFYMQGKWQEAGAAYYEAAVRLVESGQMQQVAYLYNVIQGLDRTKAEQLAVKMNYGRK